MNKEDKKLQNHLVDEMMKVSKTNPDVMIYMQSLMGKYEQLEQELERYKNIIDEAIESIERGYVVFCEQDEQCLLNFRKNLLKILKGE